MINTSEQYKAAIAADARRIYLKALIDLIDPDITYGTVTASGQSIYSQPERLHGKTFEDPGKYVTLERDLWALDGTWNIFPDDPAELGGAVGFISDAVSDEKGNFLPALWVQMNFSNVSVLQACSVYFPEAEQWGHPEDFTVEILQGTTVYHTKTVTGNRESSVSLDGFTTYNPDAIRVTVTKWSLAYRRFRCIEIVPGIYEQWDSNIISELKISQQINPSCLSLPYGTATLEMDNLSRRFEPRRKNGLFKSIEERQGIPLYLGVGLEDGSVEYVSSGVYYQRSGGWTTGNNGLTMQWDLVDIVGLVAERDYIPPPVLPTTLEAWAASIVSQLGVNFEGMYSVDSGYASKPLTCAVPDVQGKTCGEILRYVCMATGTFPRADAETGKLRMEPLWSDGNYLTLDNMTDYPTISANDDLAAVVFKLNDAAKTVCTILGNNTASSKTVTVNNPFITTQEQAIEAAKTIIAQYGGNRIDLRYRGDMRSELGDVDSVQLDQSSAASARRIKQQLSFSGGVMKSLPVSFICPEGSFLCESREIITASGIWAAPDGVTSLRIILVGGGENGANGTDGTNDADGKPGKAGRGGKIFAATIPCNSGQTFEVTVGNANSDTLFGIYSSADGQRFNGFADFPHGDVYARDGVEFPTDNSGDGGKGGAGGNKAVYVTTSIDGKHISYICVANPTPGRPGAAGGSGCAIVYYDKAVTQ